MKVIKKIVPTLVAIMITISLAACNTNNTDTSKKTANETAQDNLFPKFTGTDFNNNTVDNTLFNKNEVTLLNFWFNGCSACVNEMPALEDLNKKLQKKGAELIGINVEAGSSEKSLSEAKEILAKQGVTYRNLFINGGQKAQEYIEKIFAFPTTIMVNKSGNIIGDPITGSIEDEKKIDSILKMVDDIKDGKKISPSSSSEETTDGKLTALEKKQNNIFLEHKELWDKVFENIQKNNIEQMNDISYAEFLKAQIETCKTSFTETELKTLDNDLKKIAEIDKEIQTLIDNP
ncbi:MAG: TlpA disulfide reductase family protein [Faecalimonas umbilicata]|uniref:TlpA family protein disulfide reductase n=1 Tax=Faecalimonas umbilicata TaxID=1912855 RepID=UPI002A752EEF|nr:TlpA disulfide reductase family protein [Faecalimonas umbilicata]MDY2761216.1 TlpA disulfide reductase family protein [Faecalimonas umbilicata]